MKILFLGEGELAGPARYFLAIARYHGWRVDHRPDRAAIPATWLKRRYDVIVLSDYRHASFSASREAWIVQCVRGGTGFLMIGGWASFTGRVGAYAGSKIESLLPVRCVRGDDRVNYVSGAVLTASQEKFFSGLDWKRPPTVCGYHKTRVRPGSTVAMRFRDLRVANGGVRFGAAHPALVLGRAGHARTAAFLTDCAPHWAGGLVDWGRRRVKIKLSARNTVEVGESYLKFFGRLVEKLAL